MQSMPMNLGDKFEFGKYNGLTLTEVFLGTQALNRELLQYYVEEKIASDIVFTTHEFLLDMMGFEVGRTLLRAIPELDELNGDWSQTLEEVLRDGNSQLDRIIGRVTLDDCNTKWYASIKGKPSVAGGQPSYIEWCILNVEGFCLEERTITYLANMDYCLFEGIKLFYKIEDIYKYEPMVKLLKWDFRNEVLDKNWKTLAKIALNADDEDEGYWPNDDEIGYQSSNDVDEDYFNAMTDGQLGDYDDFIGRGGNIDEISDWAGR